MKTVETRATASSRTEDVRGCSKRNNRVGRSGVETRRKTQETPSVSQEYLFEGGMENFVKNPFEERGRQLQVQTL